MSEKVWIQAWTAQVPGSVAIERSALAQIAGLENLLPLVPMLVQVSENKYELAPSHLVKDAPIIGKLELPQQSNHSQKTENPD